MDIRSQLVGYVGALHEPALHRHAGPKDQKGNRIEKKIRMKHNKAQNPKACKLRWAPWQTEKEIHDRMLKFPYF